MGAGLNKGVCCHHSTSQSIWIGHMDTAVSIGVLQPLRWRCVECVIHHERDVREEQHPYISGANKQQ